MTTHIPTRGSCELEPVRLKAWRAQGATDRQATGEDACRAAAEAFRRRFFSGEAGPDEYRTLADLPPIPPSFDELADGEAPTSPAEPENRSEEHTSELQSLMRISYAVLCLKQKNSQHNHKTHNKLTRLKKTNKHK